MKATAKFGWVSATLCALLSLSLPAIAHAANPPQDQGPAQTQSAHKDKKQKAAPSPGKEVGEGGEGVAKGAAKGAGSLGKGTAGAAGDLATLHPGNAAADLGKGAAGAGKDVGVGTGKGAAKVGKGSVKGLGKLGKKIIHKGHKNKSEE